MTQQLPISNATSNTSCPDSANAQQTASPATPDATNRETLEMTVMTASAPLSSTVASAPPRILRPKIGDIVTGKVVAVLKDKTRRDSIPHAVILKFDTSSGLMRLREVCGDADAQRERMQQVKRGDEFSVMVHVAKGPPHDPKYELSEKRAVGLTAARALVGQIYTGKVLNTAKYGAFIGFAENYSGLLHVSEMKTTDQERRCKRIQKGDTVTVSVMSAEADPNNPGKFLFDLSEIDAELSKATQMIGRRTTTTIVGPSSTGLKLVLKSGVEVHLPLENFNNLDLDSLKVGGQLEVKITGAVGRSLSSTYEK